MRDDCKTCKELAALGVIDAPVAVMAHLAWRDRYINRVIELIGYEQATKLANVVDADVANEFLDK